MKIYFLNKTKRSIYVLKKLFNEIANYTCSYLGKENKYEFPLYFDTEYILHPIRFVSSETMLSELSLEQLKHSAKLYIFLKNYCLF